MSLLSDINECESDPCLNGGTCTDVINGYQCTCQPGYTGNNCNLGTYAHTHTHTHTPMYKSNSNYVQCGMSDGACLPQTGRQAPSDKHICLSHTVFFSFFFNVRQIIFCRHPKIYASKCILDIDGLANLLNGRVTSVRR